MKASIVSSFKAVIKSGPNKGKVGDRHLYSVTGTAEELAGFKKAQGDFYAEDAEGKPLYYSNNFCGNTCTLIVSTSGKVIADMSEFVRASSLATQFPGALGDAIAKAAAEQLLGGATASVSTPAPVKKLDE